MKRRSGASTRLISQQSSANPAITLFKLENSDGDFGDLEPGPSASLRRSKRVKVKAVIKVEDVDKVEELSATMAALAADKGKKARSSRTPSRSPQKPKAIKQVLEKPHPAPEHWRETYNSTREMCSRCPTPVNTMGYMAKWKEMESRIHDSHLARVLGKRKVK